MQNRPFFNQYFLIRLLLSDQWKVSSRARPQTSGLGGDALLAIFLPAPLADPFCFSLKEALERIGPLEADRNSAADEVEGQAAAEQPGSGP